jgi:hypothetical protein
MNIASTAPAKSQRICIASIAPGKYWQGTRLDQYNAREDPAKGQQIYQIRAAPV